MAGTALAGCALLVGDPDGHKLFVGASEDAISPADNDAPAHGDEQPLRDASEVPDVSVGEAVDATSPTDATAEASSPTDGAPSARMDVAVEAGNASSAIRCGQLNCSAGSTVCCYQDPFDSMSGGQCISESQCLAPYPSFFCSSASNCTAAGLTGYFCCSVDDNGPWLDGATVRILEGAQCTSSCDGYMQKILCDPGDPSSVTQCSSLGLGCRPSGQPPQGYYYCQ